MPLLTRRTFLVGTLMSMLVPESLHGQSTPSSSVAAKGRLSKPVLISDELALIDIRVASYFAVAEVRNVTSKWVPCAPIAVAFLDHDGNILGSDTFVPVTRGVSPNGYTLFAGSFDVPLFDDSEWESIEVSPCEIVGMETDFFTLEIIQPEIVDLEVTDLGGNGGAEVVGTIRNNSDTTDALLTATIVVFDQNDRVVGSRNVDIEIEVAAGRTARFAQRLGSGNSLQGLPLETAGSGSLAIDAIAGIPVDGWGYSC